jgi:hypothetical protein
MHFCSFFQSLQFMFWDYVFLPRLIGCTPVDFDTLLKME